MKLKQTHSLFRVPKIFSKRDGKGLSFLKISQIFLQLLKIWEMSSISLPIAAI